MAKKCCIPNCRLQKDDPGCLNLSFVQIPKDENSRNEWASSIKKYFKSEIEFKKSSYVCAMHFESSCFNYGGLCKVIRLKKGSCPTKFEKVREIELIQSSSDANNCDLLRDDERDFPSKESTVPQSPTNSTNDVSIIEELYGNNVDTRQLDDCQLSSAEDDFVDPEQVAKKSDVNRSFSDSSHVEKREIERNICRKLIVNVNLNLIDLKDTNIVRRLLENGQAEVRSLRRQKRVQSMRLYRAKIKVKSSDSLIFHVRKRNLISEKVSGILKVGIKTDKIVDNV